MSCPTRQNTSYVKTEVGFLPEHWKCLAFSALVDRVSKPVCVEPGVVYREIGIRSHGKGVFHKESITGTELGNKRVFEVEPNVLVLNIVFAWEQAVAMTSERERGMIASHRFPMYRAKTGLATEEFLHLYLLTPRGKHGLGMASPGGAGRNKTLGQSELDYLYVPVPPIAEQRRIAEILSTWDAAIEQAEKLIAAKDRMKQGLMKRLLTMKIGQSGYARGDWKRLAVSQVGSVTGGLAIAPRKTKGSMRPYLRAANIFDGFLNLNNVKSMLFTDQEYCAFKLEAGDILLNEGQSLDLVGRCAAYNGEIPDCCFQNSLIRFRANRGFHGPFFYQMFRFLHATGVLGRIASRTTSIAHLGLSRFANLRVTVPPLAEQQRIADILTTADAELVDLRNHSAALQRQKQALMQVLLTGKVPVCIEEATRG